MKILMVTMAMEIGGAETHILELCRELVRMGHRITLVSNGGVYADEAAACGVQCVRLPLHRKHPSAVMQAYSGLKHLLQTEEFDIVHAHARIPGFICGLLWDHLHLSGGRKFRFVTTAHLNFSVNPLLRRISRWGEQVMAVSEDIASYLVSEYGYPRDRIQLTINGIDTEKFSPDTPFADVLEHDHLDPNRRRVVYMSRLDADRADPAYRLLHIAEKLYAHAPDTDVLLVGGGTELERIRREADDINRRIGRTYITVTGAVSNTRAFCAAADVFVGVSRSLLEAMAAAKPVIIAGNQGSLGIFDETKVQAGVETNFCCRGYPVAAEDDLYRDVTALLDKSDAERAAMGAYNRAFVLEHYTVHRMAEDYVRMYEKTLRTPQPFFGAPDVVVSGYYGFGNLGDESLLDIIAQAVTEAWPGVKIAALTRCPSKDSRRTGLCCVRRMNPFTVPHVLRQAKLLISGGGSLLQDATSKRSLAYYAGVIRCAAWAGTKTAVLANGIGPISYPSNRKLTRQVLEQADHVSVRDPDSKAELERIGVQREIMVRADPAFLIEGAEAERLAGVRQKLGLHGGCFVVSVRPLTASGRRAADVQKEQEALLRETTAFCTALQAQYGLTPVLLPMQKSHDRALCAAITEGCPGAVLYEPADAPELIGILHGAAFVIGMRLHAVIFASSAGVPVIGLSYDPKVDSMMKALGQPYSLPVTDGVDGLAEKVVATAAEVMEHHEAIAAGLAEKAEAMRRLCREDIRQVVDMTRCEN